MQNHPSIRLPVPGPGTGVHTLHWHRVHSSALPTPATYSSTRFHVFTGTAAACALAVDVQHGIEGAQTLPGGVEVIEAVQAGLGDELGDGYYDFLAPLGHWDALGRPIHVDVEDVILHHRARDQVKKDHLQRLEDGDTGED